MIFLKKYGYGITILLVWIIFTFADSFSFSNDIVIDSYNAVITINEAGDMRVVEEWNMDYNEAMTVRFRDIAFNKYAEDYPLYEDSSNTAEFDTTDVVVKFYKDGVDKSNWITVGYSYEGDRDERYQLITCEPNIPNCESIFVNTSAAGGMSGDVTFVYEYTILGAVTQYSDISELNWRMFTYAEATVKESNIVVNFPQNTFEDTDIYVWGHGLSDGTINVTSNRQVVMDMTTIKSGQFPEFRILLENDLFPNIEDRNKVINSLINKSVIMDYEAGLSDEYNFRITVAQWLLYSSIGLSVLIFAFGIYVYIKYDKEFTPEFTGDYLRELPNDDSPAVVSFLYYMEKVNEESITATLLDLIRRGYINLESKGSNTYSSLSDYELRINKTKSVNDLEAHEKHFITWMFDKIGDGNSVTTKKIKEYGKTSTAGAKAFQQNLRTFIRLAEKAGRSKRYFINGRGLNKTTLMLANILPVFLIIASFMLYSMFYVSILTPIAISIITMALYSGYIATIKKRTKMGNELYTKWHAFKRFLEHFSSMEDYPIPSIVVWEHYLVYATVFKISDTVMSQLKIKLPESEFENSNSTYLHTSYGRHGYYHNNFGDHFRSSMTIAKMNSTSTIVKASSSRSSSRGFGGGFGGGSSFGGGGGGGRSR